MSIHIPVVENVLKLNDAVAALNRAQFAAARVFVLDVIGAPGCGKTALLEATLRRLTGSLRAGVLAGDLTTVRDAERLARWSPQVVQINTGRGCHLDANQIRSALDRVDLTALDVLFIENVGNLICPVGFDLGQHLKVGVFSLAEGDDKAAKHPYLVQEAAALVLNKIDLAPYVPFDRARFEADVRALNATAPLLETAVLREQIDPWLEWLHGAVAAAWA